MAKRIPSYNCINSYYKEIVGAVTGLGGNGDSQVDAINAFTTDLIDSVNSFTINAIAQTQVNDVANQLNDIRNEFMCTYVSNVSSTSEKLLAIILTLCRTIFQLAQEFIDKSKDPSDVAEGICNLPVDDVKTYLNNANTQFIDLVPSQTCYDNPTSKSCDTAVATARQGCKFT